MRITIAAKDLSQYHDNRHHIPKSMEESGQIAVVFSIHRLQDRAHGTVVTNGLLSFWQMIWVTVMCHSERA